MVTYHTADDNENAALHKAATEKLLPALRDAATWLLHDLDKPFTDKERVGAEVGLLNGLAFHLIRSHAGMAATCPCDKCRWEAYKRLTVSLLVTLHATLTYIPDADDQQ